VFETTFDRAESRVVLAIGAMGETVDDLVRFRTSDGGRRGRRRRGREGGRRSEDEIGGMGPLEDLKGLEEEGRGRGTRGREALGRKGKARLVLAIGRAKLIPIGSWERTFPRGGHAWREHGGKGAGQGQEGGKEGLWLAIRRTNEVEDI
jgi:hypothetical protein